MAAKKKARKQVSGIGGVRAFWSQPGDTVELKFGPAKLDLEQFTRAVCARYASDPSKPSILLSCMSDDSFYVSISRYERKYGEGKKVVCNARGASLDEALVNLAKAWRKQHNALREFLGVEEDGYLFWGD